MKKVTNKCSKADIWVGLLIAKLEVVVLNIGVLKSLLSKKKE